MLKKRGNVRALLKQSRSRLKNWTFWYILAGVFVLSVLAIIGPFDNGSLTGQVTIQTISFMQAGKELNFEVKDIPSLKEATIDIKVTVRNGQILLSPDSTIAFDGPYLSKFAIASEQADSFGVIKFLFKVKEQEMHDKNIADGDLKLYINGKEQPLAYNGREGDYLYYTGISTEMGSFVLGRKEIAEVVKTTEITPVAVESPKEPAAVAGEEKKAEESPKSLAGEAIAAPEEVSPGFFGSIVDFFKELFK